MAERNSDATSPSTTSTTLPSTTKSHVSTATDTSESTRPQSPSRKRRRSIRQSPESEPRSGPVPINTVSKQFDPPPTYSPPSLTGAAAIIDERRARIEQAIVDGRQTSPNPASNNSLQKFFTSQLGGMSRSETAIRAPTPSAPTPDPNLDTPSVQVIGGLEDGDDTTHTSPRSTSSFSSSVKAQTATITNTGPPVASPGHIDDPNDDEDEEEPPGDHRRHTHNGSSYDESRRSHALTFPGPLASHAHRTASLPQSGYGRDSARSSSKRHKCPYCNTDFTRHHNLKSHLLTHSHEKPYSCDTCDARFRRLHDLKRHTKLHTGERPHVCPKCDRSFARGDALARHNKGQGGCAGRRSSIGSFVGDEKECVSRAGDGDSMPGIMYTGEASHEPDNLEEDATDPASRRSLPSIRKHNIASDAHDRQAVEYPKMYQPRQPSTYPPIAGRGSNSGGLYPPPSPSTRAGSGTSAGQSSTNQPGSLISTSYQATGPNVFSQGNMTESPKPLSPSAMQSQQLGHANSAVHRNRSPSLTEQFQQTQFGRRGPGHTSPAQMTLPLPPSGPNQSAASQLPPLQGLTPPEPRYTLHSQSSNSVHVLPGTSTSLTGSTHGKHSSSFPASGTTSSINDSLSGHSVGPSNGPEHTYITNSSSYDRLWTYVKTLEAKINRLEGEVSTLKNGPDAQADKR